MFDVANKKINRILLKLSGEALLGQKPFGVDPDMLIYLAEEIKSIVDTGVQQALSLAAAIYLEAKAWLNQVLIELLVIKWECWQQSLML